LNERYREDAGGYLSAAIAFYGFLSFFPLVLLSLSVIGFVLAGRSDLQAEFREGIAALVPGPLAGRNLVRIVDVRTAAGLIGLIGLLWTGTGVVGAGRNAVRQIFREEPARGGLADKVWLVGVTIGLGLIALLATGLAGMAASLDAGGRIGLLVRVAGAALAFTLDLGLFLLAYRVLGRAGIAWRRLLPGALFAAAGWTLLKLIGTWYATATVERSGTVYGPFAATIGVLLVLYLAARAFVYGAELNAVLMEEKRGSGGRQRGSRSEPGKLPHSPGDAVHPTRIGLRRREKGGGPVGDPRGDGRARDGTAPQDVSTVRLVGQVAGDVGTLVKKEVELARQEITEAVMARLKTTAVFAAIGVIGLFIVGFLGLAAAAALGEVLPLWLALLIVAGAFALLAALAAVFAIGRRKRPPLKPEKAKQSIKEDVEWARAQLRR
jgi:inner membrane protein YhjD